MAKAEPRTVDGPVYEARADPAKVTHTDRHRERHAAFNVATRGRACPGEYDGDGREQATGSDGSAEVQNLYRAGTARTQVKSNDKGKGK